MLPQHPLNDGEVVRSGRWPAGVLKIRKSSSPPRDLDLEEKQPVLCFIHGKKAKFRAIHRRPLHAGLFGGVFLVRDAHVLGPWRDSKHRAQLDIDQLNKAYQAESEDGLFRHLREMHTEQIMVKRHKDCLISWEIEAEMASGKRWARVVLHGEKELTQQQQLFTIQSPWKKSRTLAEQDLKMLLRSFLSGGASDAERCNSTLVTDRPSGTHCIRVTPY